MLKVKSILTYTDYMVPQNITCAYIIAIYISTGENIACIIGIYRGFHFMGISRLTLGLKNYPKSRDFLH